VIGSSGDQVIRENPASRGTEASAEFLQRKQVSSVFIIAVHRAFVLGLGAQHRTSARTV
jgi:hypothetical protein